MGRRLRKGLAVACVACATALSPAGCSASNGACFRNCPPLEGRWLVTFEPAADPAACQQLGLTVSDGELAITRRTSALDATFGGQAYTGTVFDTWDFALDAQGVTDGGGLDAISFRGRYTAGTDGGDGGASAGSLSGTYDATLRRQGPQGPLTCLMVRSYSAVRR